MVVFYMRRALDGSGGVDVAHDRIGLFVGVTEFEERAGDGVVHDLDHAAANQFLELDQRQVGLNPRRIAVHHEAYRSGWSQDGYLGVSIAVFFAVGKGFVPALFRGFYQLWQLAGCRASLGWTAGGGRRYVICGSAYVVYAGSMHSYYV